MATFELGTPLAAVIQSEIQTELMARGIVEAGDTTMAEYNTLLLSNNKSEDDINAELAELQGIDFDPQFTKWMKNKVEEVARRFASHSSEPSTQHATSPPSTSAIPTFTSSSRLPRPQPQDPQGAPTRLFTNAFKPVTHQPQPQSRAIPTGPSGSGQKRALSPSAAGSGAEAYNKRRSLGNGNGVPTGPRSLRMDEVREGDVGGSSLDDQGQGQGQGQKKTLLERIGGPALNPNAGEFSMGNGRLANGRAYHNNQNPGPYPNSSSFQQPLMPDPWMMQQMMMSMQQPSPTMGSMAGAGMSMSPTSESGMMHEMLRQNQEAVQQMQMMMMQMQQGSAVNPASTTNPSKPYRKSASLINTPIKPLPSRAHPSTSTSKRNLSLHNPPTTPLSQEICKFSVGCTNKACAYSHPSPVASVESGVVLRTEACERGLGCGDGDCAFSHVSPAQLHGDTAGQSRVLCRFGDKCTNTACPYRHEDPTGAWIPTPALTRSTSATNAMDIDADAEPDHREDQDELDIMLDAEGSAAGLAATPVYIPSAVEVAAKRKEFNPSKATLARIDSALPEVGGGNAGGFGGRSGSGAGGGGGGGYKGKTPVACRFGAGCRNPNCTFVHARECRFGVKCHNPKCTFAHPPGRHLSTLNSISSEGITPFRPAGAKTSSSTNGIAAGHGQSLMGRTYVQPEGEGEGEVVTILPGSGSEERGEREGQGEGEGEGIKVEM